MRVVVCPQCGREHIPSNKNKVGYCSKACKGAGNLGLPPRPVARRTVGPAGVTPLMLELARALHKEDGRPMRPRALAAATGRPARGPVPYVLRLMEGRGLVARSARGTYALTSLGRAVAVATTEGDDE